MKRNTLQMLFVSVFCAFVQVGRAGAVAYWRFEGDGTNVPMSGALLTGFAQHTAVQNDGVLGMDASGNGNTIYSWDSDPNGYYGFWIDYENNVPQPVVPQTDAANQWAIFTAPVGDYYPSIATWSAASHPGGTDIETFTPKAWTIEASIYATAFPGQFHTFVGRDGNHVTAHTSYAPLYFQVINGNSANLRIWFTDVTGTFHSIQDSASLAVNHWYNVAAVSDGTNLFLYKDSTDGKGYQLVGTVVESSTNTALAVPTGAYATMSDGSTWAWSISRGRYGTSANPSGDHVDRFYGYIDEVRISDVALRPDQFLFALPKRPIVTSLILSGADAVFTGTNGPPNGTFFVLTTTNLTLPRSDWMRISTSAFDSDGNFAFTNSVTGRDSQGYYILQLQ
ncbi:MAG TPA: LamG-like jellyroll fold domain-containing protein [Candidatus Paceibacterota bacterium]|nr:LamG-like jellyroll fold domain-containing protein [Candidatus Paceibacterota bacterium]